MYPILRFNHVIIQTKCFILIPLAVLPNLELLKRIIAELLSIKDLYYMVKMYGAAMLDDDLYHPTWPIELQ